jgi:carboxypeptidase family protein
VPGRPQSVVLAVALLCLWVIPLSGAQTAISTSLPAWGTEPSPNAGFPRNAFAAVDAISAADAWAVGRFDAGGSEHPRPLVEHWDGSSWRSVGVQWNQESELLGVAAVASNDVWMVGGDQQGGSALIARWNGATVATVPHPNPGAFNRLYAVTAIAANDAWAVGEFTNPISRTLALHWNGSVWTQVPTPTGAGYSHLYGVTALASNDVWAVGDDGNDSLTLHWNGSQWTRVASPSSTTLRAVSAAPDGTVWAVGDNASASVTLRWSGSLWTVVPSPSPGSNFLDLNGVVSLSATDAWAVGVYDVSGNWRTLTMHWNGSAWTVVSSPSPDPVLNRLDGVAASGSSVWSVGWAGGSGSMAIRLQGSSWQRVATANEGTGENQLNGISARSSRDIWAVGQAENQSLTMHFDGSAWTVVPSPNLDRGVQLEDVVTLDANDAWAVGWSNRDSLLDDVSVAMHWDGVRWTIVPTPQPGGDHIDRLLAVDAVGPNDVWAVGLYSPNPVVEDHSLILHWNGTSWSIVPHNCDTYAGLTGITLLSATQGWAVGDSETCRYDGSSWTEVSSPQPRLEYSEIAYPLEDASGVAPTDVWAVGARVIDTPYTVEWRAITEHWNGTHWTIDFNVPGQSLYGVEALRSNDVYAVGTDSFGPLILHYDGVTWSTVPTPEWGRGGRLAGIDSVSKIMPSSGTDPARELWTAGNYRPGQGPNRTLIQRAPSPTQGAVVGSTNVADATVSWFGPENGSVETDDAGDYQVGGLTAGTYTFTATNPGCTPASAMVTVRAGLSLRQDFQIGCARAGRARAAHRPRDRGTP